MSEARIGEAKPQRLKPFRFCEPFGTVEEAAEKGRFGVIPNEVRNPSFAIVEQKERFLVAALLGMTPVLLFSAICETVP